jgi:hypothetical protein
MRVDPSSYQEFNKLLMAARWGWDELRQFQFRRAGWIKLLPASGKKPEILERSLWAEAALPVYVAPMNS